MQQAGVSHAVEANAAIGEPELERLLERGLPAGADVHAAMDRQRRRVATGFLGELTELRDRRADIDWIETGDQQRHPPVGLAHDPAQHGIGRATADQDRQRMGRQRVDPHAAEVVEAAIEVDDRLAPQQPHHIDLLFEQSRCGRRNRRRAPSYSAAFQPTPTASRIRPPLSMSIGGDLLGDDRRLALRQHQHAGDEAHLRRQRRRGG